MLRKLPSFVLLASLFLASLESATAQWPTDDLLYLYRSPTSQVPAATETPRIAQGTIATSPELNGPGMLPAPAEQIPPGALTVPGQLPAAEPLPVAEDSNSWILPSYWFNPVGWEGSLQVGINGTSGNSETTSYVLGSDLKRKTELYELKFDMNYVNTSANGVETQNNAIQNLRYERNFGGSPWSFFTREYLEYDEFKPFDLRLALNAGIGYKFIDTEATTLKGRYGAGVSHEFGGPSDDWVPELVYGADFRRQLTKRQKLELTVDYFPKWGNFDDYRMVTQLGWQVVLSEKHNLNLKLSVNDRYDSTPDSGKPNILNYALLLLWKL